jgi:hypothetical protein
MFVLAAVRQPVVRESLGCIFIKALANSGYNRYITNIFVMKLVILYRPKSEHSTLVESFSERIVDVMPEATVEKIDVDSPDGIMKLEAYGIYQFPAILIIANDGSLIDTWTGDFLPSVDQVADSLRR